MSNSGLLDVVDIFYTILNSTTLTDEISGGLFKNKAPMNREDLEDVIIIGNFLNHKKYQEFQPGLYNINIELPSITDGTINHSRLKVIANIIRTLLENNKEYHTKGLYYDIVNETVFDQRKQNQKSFYNFRIDVKKQ